MKSTSTRSWIARLSWLPLCALLLGCPEIRVFHSPSNNGAPGLGGLQIAAGTTATVNLYIDRIPRMMQGDTMPAMDTASVPAGSACSGQSADPGDEICQWLVEVVADPGLTILNFTPEPNVVSNLAGNTLRATGGNAINPDLSSERIGTIVVQASPSSAGAQLGVTGQYVRASLDLENIPRQLVGSVPNPQP